MKNAWREINLFLGRFLSPAVRYILLANVIVFILMVLLTPFSKSITAFFGLLIQRPVLVVERFFLWQLVTYMFMHADVLHLLFNMLILWFFAPRLEYRWGTQKFLRFYVIVGVGAGLINILASYLTYWGGQEEVIQIGMLGASGAIYGVLLAYALTWPNDTVLLYFAIPIKIKYLMIILGVFAFLGSVGSSGDGISHVTHLGGILVAFIYLKAGPFLGGGGGKRRKRKPKIVQVDPRNHPDFR
ncbi:MAG: rhomboid family intramembrane serine protease [Candidatus Sumerlaeia bacterium]